MVLSAISILFIVCALASATIVFIDQYVLGNRQRMKIMNLVWILTCLWSGIFGLWAYYSFGRERPKHTIMSMEKPMEMTMKMDSTTTMNSMSNMNTMPNMETERKPLWQNITKSTLHCGAGCTLADLIGEWFVFFVPMSLLLGWTLDYVLALVIGVIFQYTVISAMEHLPKSKAYAKALKVDFWSLTAWQTGMYGFMALAIYGFGIETTRLSCEFWFMMQIAMMCGFLTSYPINALLIKLGIKKGM